MRPLRTLHECELGYKHYYTKRGDNAAPRSPAREVQVARVVAPARSPAPA